MAATAPNDATPPTTTLPRLTPRAQPTGFWRSLARAVLTLWWVFVVALASATASYLGNHLPATLLPLLPQGVDWVRSQAPAAQIGLALVALLFLGGMVWLTYLAWQQQQQQATEEVERREAPRFDALQAGQTTIQSGQQQLQADQGATLALTATTFAAVEEFSQRLDQLLAQLAQRPSSGTIPSVTHRIFLSSTSLDLATHRATLGDALARMDQFAIDMKQFGAGGADATTVSLTELATAEYVVLLVAWRYGFIPDGATRSITQLEYLKALELKKPVFVYLADPSTEAEDGSDDLFPAITRQPQYTEQLAAFRDELMDSNKPTFEYFTTPDDLAKKVATALARRLLGDAETRAASVAQGGVSQAQERKHALVKARELDPTTFNLGDNFAATFPYQIAPIQALQTVWKTTVDALIKASENAGDKQGVLILGESSAGKTRLALEALKETLPNWPVLRWSEVDSPDRVLAPGALPSDGLVIFLDDLPRFAPLTQPGPKGQVVTLASNPAANLRKLLEAVTARPLVIVATCRLEDEGSTQAELGWLFKKLTVIHMPRFNTDKNDPEAQQVIAIFREHGVIHEDDWDSTPGSLVLGLSTKHEEYERLKVRQSPAVVVLRAMKLLYLAEISEHTEQRLRAVCNDVFNERAIAQDDSAWQDAVDELLRLQFVRIDTSNSDGTGVGSVTLVIRKDVYFDQDKVLTDYPNPANPGQLERHLALLQKTLSELEDATGLYALGWVFFDRKDYGKALEAYERALALQPDHANAWFNKGFALGQLERYTEALEAYERALALQPDHANAWFIKGLALNLLERHPEALEAYERALALRPDDANAWYLKGIALRHLERYTEALEAYERALALRPDDADTWYLKGIALRHLERYTEALDAFDRALALQPDHANTWNSRAYALLGLKQYDLAVASIDRALALEPEEANWWDSRGEILLAASRFEEALAAYDQALARSPDFAPSCKGKAQALRALGRATEAEAFEESGQT